MSVRSCIVVCCGGRDYTDRGFWIDAFEAHPPTTVIHGQCRGADVTAGEVARMLGITVIEVPAIWSTGRGAGYRRNIQMAHLGLLLAGDDVPLLIAAPGGRGTAHMVETATTAGFKVIERNKR